MNNRLYVGNLPYTVSEDELSEIFAQFGNVVSARVITDARTGRSKGFGFVELETEDQAREAIDQMNGADVQGRAVRVATARPPQSREGGRGPRDGDKGW